jgi:hypothetical protein
MRKKTIEDNENRKQNNNENRKQNNNENRKNPTQ